MIPPFDKNNVLPPYVEGGNPTNLHDQSPYKSDIVEFCTRFATSAQRKSILQGFVKFRLDALSYGINGGIQWIDGSFVEDIEKRDNRAPHDIDVLSMVYFPSKEMEVRTLHAFPSFANHNLSKINYMVDHFPLILNYNPIFVVNYTKYWSQLFGHNRNGVWKGMVELPLYADTTNDMMAMDLLRKLQL